MNQLLCEFEGSKHGAAQVFYEEFNPQDYDYDIQPHIDQLPNIMMMIKLSLIYQNMYKNKKNINSFWSDFVITLKFNTSDLIICQTF